MTLCISFFLSSVSFLFGVMYALNVMHAMECNVVQGDVMQDFKIRCNCNSV